MLAAGGISPGVGDSRGDWVSHKAGEHARLRTIVAPAFNDRSEAARAAGGRGDRLQHETPVRSGRIGAGNSSLLANGPSVADQFRVFLVLVQSVTQTGLIMRRKSLLPSVHSYCSSRLVIFWGSRPGICTCVRHLFLLPFSLVLFTLCEGGGGTSGEAFTISRRRHHEKHV